MNMQNDRPLFVRARNRPVVWKGRTFNWQDHFPWKELGVPQGVVQNLYEAYRLHHNPELEKQTQVGDRLEEFEGALMKTLVTRVNAHVKDKANSTQEFTSKKVKQSRNDTKQRGLIRSWLRNNKWAEDKYFEIRDSLLEE